MFFKEAPPLVTPNCICDRVEVGASLSLPLGSQVELHCCCSSYADRFLIQEYQNFQILWNE